MESNTESNPEGIKQHSTYDQDKKARKGKPKGGPEDDTEIIIESSEKLEIVQSFDELNLSEELLRGVYAYGFDKPSAVQKRAILPILQSKDVIVQSQSGTGKTCVFSLGALHCVDLSNREPQALVLSPSRELAEQTQKVIQALGDYMSVKVHCCIGGRNVNDDIFKLEHGVHIVSGTPGRVFDMI